MSELTVFDELEKEKVRLESRMLSAHALWRTAQSKQYRQSDYFALLAIIFSVLFLAIVGIFLDYLIMLDFTMTRIIVWIALLVFVVGISRFAHAWIFTSRHLRKEAHDVYYDLQKEIETVEKYELGTIDTDGIRLFYQSRHNRAVRSSYGVFTELVDWLMYILIMLIIVLFGLIFI